MDITNLKAWEIREKILNKEISSYEVTEQFLEKIDEVEDEINAFITIDADRALDEAKKVDEKIAQGIEIGILAGLPVAVKDNIMTKNLRTTCASKMLEKYIPPYNATVVEKIKKEDGIIIGKTNMDEFAMGGSTETSYFGITRNPRNKSIVPGGSSGGSAAAIAANEAALSLGTDTGGSIRQPASYCGVVGIKPTYGLVSRFGVVPMSNSLDQVGVFGKDVKDAYLALKSIAGFDPHDATSSKRAKLEELNFDEVSLKGLKIALPKEYDELRVKGDEKIRVVFENSIRVFERNGAKIEYVSLPYLKYALETYYLISTAEVSTNLSRFDGIRYGHRAFEYKTLDELYINSRTEGFGEETKRRIMMGTYALSQGYKDEHYKKALKIRTLIKNDYDRIFKDYDVILSITSPILPFPFDSVINSPVDMYKADTYTVPVNLAGLCAISVPMGEVDSLPVGLQITANRFNEKTLFTAAYGYERSANDEL
ncbi:MAG: Asp-tRNA(Asn)/Glu-tRNA(Gln) amidotransferase subunit GatA [Tissierellales bacterium]|nr:Asp-tRNA(Asn)/Glu-tRNA(Gln) amidotransferase subunit GatA [Tissierellales bacterium]